ncbi:MAG: Arylsulfatase A family enzyme [Candidatus Methanohalarchaeum thermophilum]|uniref:Arylsulfatase A family enzyme n=1 Tax=Methanohalarchaeum thermophilum TaxID=1903181 RepID=A0A1Q6DWX3_METT1|nr:MAG: Arylsulfatase A family enzyme [Candidatus Methanohalarchaeum thermophilum]
MKEQDPLNEEWDNLIILDACRYDFFKRNYQDYLSGELEKRKSKASNTGEWLTKNFKEKYDITYISANPYVNNFGIPLNKCHPKFEYEWKATDHFKQIINVWATSWDRDLGTVHPREVNMQFFRTKIQGNKKILHYLQPHMPHLSETSVGSWANTINRVKKGDKLESFQNWLRPRLRKRIGKLNYWKIRKLLNLEPRNPFEVAWRKKDPTEIKEKYEDNLIKVLDTVSNLIEEINGKTIVTADHGEAFGEKGIWEHPPKTHIPELTTVPWLKTK